MWQMGEHRLYVGNDRKISNTDSVHLMSDFVGVNLEEEVEFPTAFRGSCSFFCKSEQLPTLYSFYSDRKVDLVGIRIFPEDQDDPSGYIEDLQFLFCATRFGINSRNVEPVANRSRLLTGSIFAQGIFDGRGDIWENQILLMSEEGDVILDPFAGMGGCLIACIRAGRISYNIEPDPYNADVILSRYEAATGAKAVRVSSFIRG
jgi:hypothetical protein